VSQPATLLGRPGAPANPNEAAPEINAQAAEGEERIDEDVAARDGTGQRLRQFGYDLFAGAPSTFAPATNIPVPANYVVGPGDTVIINLYGQQNMRYELAVTREGILQ